MKHPRTGKLFDSPVPPGSGWPGDPATPLTPVAHNADEVVELAAKARSIHELDAMISVCRACPRLVAWREEVAVKKRKAFADQPYWGRPVPSFGVARPRLMVVALAPAANGANRTGRAFTGDRSGDELFAALYRVGLASAPESVDAGDGLRLKGTRVIAPVRCAPPDNVPTTVERHTCSPWLTAEWRLTHGSVRVILALGGFGWHSALTMIRSSGGDVGKPQPKFGHAVEAQVHSGKRDVVLLGCYHPSQHNTFTGRLTRGMLDQVFSRARELAGIR